MAGEKILQTKILKDLRSLGKYCICFKIEKSSDNGIPDIFFSTVISGPILLEIKDNNEKPNKLQLYQINKSNLCGCKTYWVDSWQKWIELKKNIGIPCN